MTNKLHNRTLFVAALSVYLGLLVVGAPPQVLAQTTRTLEKSEQVFVARKNFQSLGGVKRKNESSWLNLGEAFKEFFGAVAGDSNLKTLFDKSDFEFEIRISRAYVSEDCPPPRALKINSKNLDKTVESELSELVDSFFYFSLAEDANGLRFASPNEVSFKFNQNGIDLKTASTWGIENRDNAVVFGGNLQNLYRRKAGSGSALERVVYSNTEISVKNDQVFIVTRLPRAGLDSLLKADEKAN